MRPAVAAITAHHSLYPNTPPPEAGWTAGNDRVIIGTAFVIDLKGIVLTAGHVISEFIEQRGKFHPPKTAPEQRGLQLVFQQSASKRRPVPDLDSAYVPADNHIWIQQVTIAPPLYIIDDQVDLAVLYTDPIPLGTPFSPTYLSLSKSEPMVGTDVIVCGFPHGQAINSKHGLGVTNPPTFSHGIIGAILPDWNSPPEERSAYRFDAQVLGGNSGGPVCDRQTGKVYGVQSTTTVLNLEDGRTKIPTGFPEAVALCHIRRFIAYATEKRASAHSFQILTPREEADLDRSE